MRQNGLDESEAIAVDGKSLSGIYGQQIPSVYLVSAFSNQSGVVVGQQSVENKGGELEALRRLLEEVDKSGGMHSSPRGAIVQPGRAENANFQLFLDR